MTRFDDRVLAHTALRPAAQRGLPAWVVVLGVGCLACSGPGRGRAPALRQPSDSAGRTDGCIDTPFIAGDERATGSGIQCGRAASGDTVALRGRVVAEEIGGLPGTGLEGLWIGVHAVGDRAVNLDALPPALVEGKTGAGGRFDLLVKGKTELLFVVRSSAAGRMLAARRVLPVELDSELQLLVPLDSELRRELGLPDSSL